MKLTYTNPQTVYERAVTSCESKIIDMESRTENEKRHRAIEVQKFLLEAAHCYHDKMLAEIPVATNMDSETAEALIRYYTS